MISIKKTKLEVVVVVTVIIVVIVVLSGVKMRITVIYVHVLSVLDVCTHDWQ